MIDSSIADKEVDIKGEGIKGVNIFHRYLIITSILNSTGFFQPQFISRKKISPIQKLNFIQEKSPHLY